MVYFLKFQYFSMIEHALNKTAGDPAKDLRQQKMMIETGLHCVEHLLPHQGQMPLTL